MSECICDKCPKRFECFTQKKVFSDPQFQALFEAYIGSGCSPEEASAKVAKSIEDARFGVSRGFEIEQRYREELYELRKELLEAQRKLFDDQRYKGTPGKWEYKGTPWKL